MSASPRPFPRRPRLPWRPPTRPFVFALIMLVLAGSALASPTPTPAASADTPTPAWLQTSGLRLDSVRVDVHATGGLARTNLTFVLHNPSDVPEEGRFDVPLPPHATLTAFSLEVDGETWHGVVQERLAAQRTYDDAKERGEDAVLLESADDTRFRLHLNVPSGADRTLHVTYVQALPLESDARTYRLSLSGLSDLPGGLAHLETTLHITSTAGISDVRFPGLALETTDTSNHTHTARYEASDVTSLEDLVAHWNEGDAAWRPSLVSSATPGAAGADDAALVASLVPPAGQGHLPRDIVFVLDSSGSMGGDKIVQARESLREVLLTLRAEDRFGLVRFSSDIERITTELQPATDGAIQQARDRLASVGADGSTNFDGGLQAGIDLLGAGTEGRVPVVVVLSDGLPTAGVTAHASIVSRMHAANDADAAIHILAIGLDADDTFLEDIAGATGGSLLTLAPGADLRTRLADFYATLQDPVLTAVTVTIDGPGVRGLYPAVVPAIYAGSAVEVTFRANLSSAPSLVLHLEGLSADGPVSYDFAFDAGNTTVLAEADRVWGSHHVGALLSEERNEGPNEELRQTIVSAAIQYGIVTRHTSWVIVAPQPEVVPKETTAAGPAPTSTPTAAPTQTPDTALRQNGNAPAAHYDPNMAADGTADTAYTGGPSPSGGDDAADGSEEATPLVAPALFLAAVAVMALVARRRT